MDFAFSLIKTLDAFAAVFDWGESTGKRICKMAAEIVAHRALVRRRIDRDRDTIA
jgi:hypothetical protein